MNVITPGYLSKFNKLDIPTSEEIQEFMYGSDDDISYIKDLGIYIEPPNEFSDSTSELPILKMDIFEIIQK